MVGSVVVAAEEEAVGGTDSVGWLEALVAAASLETVGMRRAQPPSRNTANMISADTTALICVQFIEFPSFPWFPFMTGKPE